MHLFPHFLRHTQKKSDPSAEAEKKLVTALSVQRIPTTTQLRYLSSFLSGEEKRNIKILSTIFVLGSILFFGIHAFDAGTEPARGGIYREGLIGSPQYINPVLASANEVDEDIVRLLFRGLLKKTSTGAFAPDLAEHFSVSSDSKTYTLKLKPQVFWHDREPITLDDVVYTYETIQNPQYASPIRTALGQVKMERLGDFEIVFRLDEPFVRFPELLTIGILPEHLWADTPPEAFLLSTLNTKPVGSGPFVFDSFTKDSQGRIKSFAVIRNTNAAEPTSYLDRFEFHFFSNSTEALRAFRTHNIDGLKSIQEQEIKKLTESNLARAHEFAVPHYLALFFNLQKNGVVKDKMIRTAIAYSIDHRELLSQARSGAGTIVQTPVLPGQIGYDPEFHERLPDLEKAKRSLEEQGWKPGPDGMRTKGSTPLSATLTTGNTQELLSNANLVQKSLQKIGFTLRLEVIESRNILEKRILDGSYEMLLLGQETGSDPDPFPYWHSSQINRGTNLSRYTNRSVDTLLEDARKETDKKKRSALYQNFQKKFLEDIPALILYSPWYQYITDTKIKGIPSKTFLSDRSERLISTPEWYIKTK